MSPQGALPAAISKVGLRVALLFALVAENLQAFYEHGRLLTVNEGAMLAAQWLARGHHGLRLAERQRLAEQGRALAGDIAATLSRQAGLFTAHELSQALDPRYQSETAEAVLAECQRWLAETEETPDLS